MIKTRLRGYTYELQDGLKARDEGRMLTIRIETSLACNMRCRYCAWDSGTPLDDEIDIEELKSFIDGAAKRGIKSVIIVGGGEPTIYKHFKELIQHISGRNLIPVVITNGLRIDREMAHFLYENNASVLLKYDSMREETQNYLSGMDGAYEKIQSSLKNLIDIGFTDGDDEELRLGLSFVITKRNLDEIVTIWKYCRDNNIYPNLELLNPIGRAKENEDEIIPEKQAINEVLYQLKELDKNSYKIEQNDENVCLQHTYSMYLNVQGFVQPCGAMRYKKYKYRDFESFEACYDNQYFSDIRKTEHHLDVDAEYTCFSV